MDELHRAFVEKIAQDAGAPPPPQFLTGVGPEQEFLIRARTRAAAQLRHLPPEIAYSLAGGAPITDSPAHNVAIQQAVDRAADRAAAARKALQFGIPGAAAGALLGNILGGSGRDTAIGAALGGLAAGYPAYRMERKTQARLARELARLREEYAEAQERAAEEALQAAQEQALLEEIEQQMARQQPKGRRKQAALEPYDASKPKTPKSPFANPATAEAPVDAPTWGEKKGSAQEEWEEQRLRAHLHRFAEAQRLKEKIAAAGAVTGNQFSAGVGRSPAPSSPQGASLGQASPGAPRMSMAAPVPPPPPPPVQRAVGPYSGRTTAPAGAKASVTVPPQQIQAASGYANPGTAGVVAARDAMAQMSGMTRTGAANAQSDDHGLTSGSATATKPHVSVAESVIGSQPPLQLSRFNLPQSAPFVSVPQSNGAVATAGTALPAGNTSMGGVGA